MVFSKYSPPRRSRDTAIVAITRKRLQLNSICQKLYFKDHRFAELYFDKENKMIGIKPLKEETKDAIIIRRYEKRGIAVIAATNFIREFNIEGLVVFEVKNKNGVETGERSVQIPVDWDKENKMLILKLR